MKLTVLRSKPRDERLRDLIRQAKLAAARAEALLRAN